MPADIQEYDIALRQIGTPVSWHGLEKETNNFDELKIRYTKEEFPLPPGYVYAGENCRHNIVAHKSDDLKVVIATCSEEYQVLGNDEIMETWFQAFAEHGIPAKLVFGLTMSNLSKLALTFTIENMEEFFAGGQKHDMFVVAVGGHDKTIGCKGFGTSTKVVCANTLKMALSGSKHILDFNFYHNVSGIKAFKNLPALIEATLAHAKEYSEYAERLGNVPINIHQAKAISAQILAASAGKNEISSQIVNRAEAITGLFHHGKGNSGQSLWDLLGGATEFFTSGDGSGKTKSFRKMISSEFGTAADYKVQFANAFRTPHGDVISQDELNSLVREGEMLLEKYDRQKNAVQLVMA